MPIDYSKWDNLDEYSDSDGDDHHHDEGGEGSHPRVTRLDEPSRITFGGSNNEPGSATIEPQPSMTSTLPRSEEARPGAVVVASTASADTSTWTEKGGSIVTSDNRQLYWSQDRYSVQIRLELLLHPSKETAEGVQVNGILPYADRHCATGSQKPHLILTGRLGDDAKSTVTLLEGDLPHPVHWSQDDEEGGAKSLDWTIERNPVDNQRRFVVIALYKAVPMQGVFVWWKRPLLQFDEITLEEDDTERSVASKEFIQAWDEAHRLFRETKRPPPQTLPPDE